MLFDLMSRCGKPNRDLVGVAGVGVCDRVRVGGRCEVGEEGALVREEPCQLGTKRKLECA